MAQIQKKQFIDVRNGSDYYNKFYKSQNNLKSIILNYIFRNIAFVTNQDKIRALTTSDYENITEHTNIPIKIIHKFTSCFLIDLIKFKRFVKKNPQILNSKRQTRIVRIYLHKFYRLAPVFNFKRARENARILRIKLDKLFFWPQIMTQIAIIIFITDLLDKNFSQKLIQTNLRALCNCSAYAFHRTRNKIGFTSNYIKDLLILK
ncbi:MAG: hypothetical protein ACFFCE_17430 [Promethearchaeota archaeon]